MPFARGDMRDHIVSHKNDHGASYGRYAVLQWWGQLRIELFARFSASFNFRLLQHYRHIAAPDVYDGTSAVGESRHRIPRRIRWSTD